MFVFKSEHMKRCQTGAITIFDLMSYRDVVESSFEVKATGGGVVVSVSFELHAGISEDGRVVSPGRFGQVHIPRTRMETRL